MTFDLEAARALHDRSPYGYGCTTCIDGMGNPLDWPCETAKALGATGRSEWLDTPAPKPGPAVTYNITADAISVTKLPAFDLTMESTLTPEETTALVDHLTRTKEPEEQLCGWASPAGLWTCDRPRNHMDAHDRQGRLDMVRDREERLAVNQCTWVLRDGSRCSASGPDEPHHATQCDQVSVSGRRCQLGLGHVATFHDFDPELCGHVVGEDICTEVKGHIVSAALPHRSGPRTWWPTEACDGVGDNTYLNCCLAKGHKLRCHFSYHDDTDLVRCCDLSRSETPCALPQGHTGSHADLDGLRWGGLPESAPAPAPESAPVCGASNPMLDQDGTCVLELGHVKLHDDESGMQWSDSAEPQSESESCKGRLSTSDGELRCQLSAGHVGVHTRGDRTWNWYGVSVTMCPEAGCAYVAGHVASHRGWDGRLLS